MQGITTTFQSFLTNLHMPSVRWTDIVEILIIAFILYHILLWFRNTRAWALMKGVLIILLFVLLAAVFNMTTILWLVQNVTGIAVMALVVILQPELRTALEELGQKNLISSFFSTDSSRGGTHEGFTDHTINEIMRSCTEMAKAHTGALIVIENKTPLQEYVRTGIDIDAVVSSQLLINIFEKNTPLHDGAVIIRGNRVISATCYLPLSENKLDKDLGTRHRAGVGLSEVSDSLTVIVSEETGNISVAYRGKLTRALQYGELKDRLKQFQSMMVPGRRSFRAKNKKEKDEGAKETRDTE
ncbi:MAG: diadenylate cyclase CdaA [Lachnospiraceae bacterium]|nr:diadenylate cyclase CdaA [Lachnospiraceae bacterium]